PSSWPSALFASSTRYAMFASKPVEHLPRWLRSPSLHISQASLNSLNGRYALQKLLVGFCILHDDLGFSVDRQDQRVAGSLEAVEEFRGIALKIADGSNVVGNVQHGASPNLHRI